MASPCGRGLIDVCCCLALIAYICRLLFSRCPVNVDSAAVFINPSCMAMTRLAVCIIMFEGGGERNRRLDGMAGGF